MFHHQKASQEVRANCGLPAIKWLRRNFLPDLRVWNHYSFPVMDVLLQVVPQKRDLWQLFRLASQKMSFHPARRNPSRFLPHPFQTKFHSWFSWFNLYHNFPDCPTSGNSKIVDYKLVQIGHRETQVVQMSLNKNE